MPFGVVQFIIPTVYHLREWHKSDNTVRSVLSVN
jgi:hypothetical protein